MAEGGLDPLLHQPVRARVMAYLYRNRQAAFTTVRDTLGLTSGNLQSHAAKLAEAGLIEVRRAFSGVFEVRYFITEAGMRAFREYAENLQRLIEAAGLDPGERVSSGSPPPPRP